MWEVPERRDVPNGAKSQTARRPKEREVPNDVRDFAPFAFEHDVSYSARGLRRTPGLAATVIVTLALGIGVNATLYSLLDRLFVAMPSGIDRPDQVRRLYWRPGDAGGRSSANAPFSIPIVDAVREGLQGVAAITVYQRDKERFEKETEPSTVVRLAGPQYFSLLGVRPGCGHRDVAPEIAGA